MKKCMMAAILICGTTMALTSCSDKDDNPVEEPQTVEDLMKSLYGENKKITNGNYNKSLAVKCVNGTFVGQQPIGALRWKAPVDVVPDNGIYEAYYYGKTPVHADGDPAALYVQGEDCLYLNVWQSAKKSAAKKPVMVWIYGGGFETGGTIDPQYDCTNFINENPDMIVVTVAYRLAAYGFMHLSHLPDGSDYPDAQNLGILDQLMALKWVHENIAGFGGDPDNVTIFGESAGGSSCTLLPLVSGAQKYFKRVISQSGSPIMSRSTEEAIACTDMIMAELGCKTVADLQKVSSSELASTVGRLLGIYQVLGWRIWPERDGRVLPVDPWEAYANGAAKDIEYLVGCNKDEMNTFSGAFGAEKWNKWATDRMAKKAQLMTDEENALVESYLKSAPGEDWEKTSNLFSQAYFNAPAIRLSENQTSAGGKVFTYLFTPEASTPMVKSGHAIEQSAVFNHPELCVLIAGRAFDETFCKTMRKLWIQFANPGSRYFRKKRVTEM